MNSKLLKTCFCFFLIDNATGVNPTIKVDANEGYIKIEGEIKDVIMARLTEKKLKLLKDNGDDADEEDRTYTFFTLTGILDNTYEIYRVRNEEVTNAKASSGSRLYPVIYINSKTIYSDGTGTYNDPYIVR